MLRFSSDKFQNHSQAEDFCKKLTTWIKEDAPQAGSFAISQLKDKLKKPKRNPPRPLTKGGSLLNVIKRNGNKSYDHASTVIGMFLLFEKCKFQNLILL